MGRTGKGRHARRAVLALAGAVCALAIAATAAQAQGPLNWSAPVGSDATSPGALGITAVSCQSVSLCVAVDDAGDVLSSTAPVTGVWGTPGAIYSSAPHLTAVSCPSATLCVATDNHGNAYASATPTSPGWTIEAAIDATNQINGISCPSTTLCVAVDNDGNILTSAAPGSQASWTVQSHVDATTAIAAVSCPTSTLCAAVDSAGNVLVSTNPTSGSSWQSTSLSTGALTRVSCNSSATCVAVAANGSVYAAAAAQTAPVTWSVTPVDPPGPLSAVSCTDAGVCVVVDHSGRAFQTASPTAPQPGWTPTTIDSGHALTSVSCLAAGLCVAVDSSGYTITGTLPAPTVTTGSGSAGSQTNASLAATVNPNDATLSDCHFDYGLTTAYGASVPCTVLPSATGGSQAVVAQIGGLSASTTYHFRIAASSGVATADGADATFTTAAPLKASPSLSGTPAVGNTLTCKPNVTTTATETISYQWLSDTVPIAGATAATFIIVAGDESHHLSCQVTIAGDGGSAVATSGFDAVPSQAEGTVEESFVGTDAHTATSASAPVTCSPQADGGCTIKLLLTAKETVHHKSETVTVGSSTTKLQPGAKRTLKVSLNATGKRLLKKQHTLAATLTVSGTIIGTLTAKLQSDDIVFGTKAKADTKARHAARRAR